MEKSYKEDYDALKYYINNTREEILKDKNSPVNKKEENKLLDLGLITFDKNSKDLYNQEYIFTQRGNEQYLKFKEIWQKNWAFWFSLGAIIISLVNLYFYLKMIGIIK